MIHAKARVFFAGALVIAAACGGQAVSSTDGGAKDGATSDGGSSGTSGASGASGSSGTSGASGSSGTSGSTSGSSGASGSSGSTGQVVCLTHDVVSTGTQNNCKVTDTVQCGSPGTVNDEYEVICQCTSVVKNCDCIMNNAETTQVTVTTCPSCDPSILQGAYSKCGFPY